MNRAFEPVFRELERQEGEWLFPEESRAIAELGAQDKASLEALILERAAASGEPDFRQLLALELIGSERAVPFLRRAFAAAGHKIGDWKDLEFAVALWRTAKDPAMLDFAIGTLSGLLVTRRIAAARALRGAACRKAAEALRGVVFGDGEPRLRLEALRSLAEQAGVDIGIPLEDSAFYSSAASLDALAARWEARIRSSHPDWPC